MTTIAACLKVKINNQEAKLNSFVDLNFNNLSDISTEQLAVVRLLKNYLGGFFRWSQLLPDRELGIMDGVGGMGGEPADKSGFYIGTINMREYPFSFAAFDEQQFRSAISEVEDVMKPFNFDELVNAASLEDLQQLIDDEINSSNPKYTVTAHTEPVTMSILRCTQDDINSIAIDGAPPHVDMFDSLMQMLPHHSPTLDNVGYAPAYYDARLDQIVFKSKFGLHQKLAGSNDDFVTSVTVSKDLINDTVTNYLFSYQINDRPIVRASFDGSSFMPTSLADYIVWHMPDDHIFKFDFDRHPSDNEILQPFWINNESDANGNYVFSGLDGTENIPNVTLFEQQNTLKFLLTPDATNDNDLVRILFGGDIEIRSSFASSGSQ